MKPKEQNAGVFRRLIREGERSGEPVDGEAALRRLEAKYLAMAQKNAEKSRET
jgi:hypothetical protein